MNILVKRVGAAIVIGAMALGIAAPATAAPWHRHHRAYYMPYPAYDYYPAYNYYYPDYYDYGYYPRYSYDPGPAIAASVIGGIFGTILSQAAHSQRCVHVYHRNGRTYCR